MVDSLTDILYLSHRCVIEGLLDAKKLYTTSRILVKVQKKRARKEKPMDVQTLPNEQLYNIIQQIPNLVPCSPATTLSVALCSA